LSEKEIKIIKSNSIGEEFVGSKNPKFDADLDSYEIEDEEDDDDLDDVEEEEEEEDGDDDSEIIEMFNEISKGKEFITLKQVINIYI
jgi:hypothetical protein